MYQSLCFFKIALWTNSQQPWSFCLIIVIMLIIILAHIWIRSISYLQIQYLVICFSSFYATFRYSFVRHLFKARFGARRVSATCASGGLPLGELLINLFLDDILVVSRGVGHEIVFLNWAQFRSCSLSDTRSPVLSDSEHFIF